MWVWALKTAHHNLGVGFVCFFGLGCFSVVFCVWGAGVVHTDMLDSMLRSVSVVWRYVEVFCGTTRSRHV